MGDTVVSFVIAAVLAGGLIPLIIGWLRRRDVLDHPDHRTSHVVPTPRGAGLAFLGALVLVAVVSSGLHDRIGAGVCLAALAVGALGAAEDLHGVDAKTRLALQLVVGIGGSALVASAADLDVAVAIGVAVAGGLWFAALVNGVNFMDGINGITGAFALVCGGYFMWLGHDIDVPALAASGAVLAGAAVGFLPYNVPTARVFMGDSGSYLIGGLTAMCVIVAAVETRDVVAAAAPTAYYLVDTGTTLFRRWRRNEALLAPHRSHAYQRLVASGWSHTTVSAVVLIAMAAGATAGAIRQTASDGDTTLSGVIAGATIVAIGIAVVVVADRRDRTARPTD